MKVKLFADITSLAGGAALYHTTKNPCLAFGFTASAMLLTQAALIMKEPKKSLIMSLVVYATLSYPAFIVTSHALKIFNR